MKICILRLDAIGDYLLFRNCIAIVKNYYPNSKICLIGNPRFRELSEALDGHLIDEYIWVDQGVFYSKKCIIDRFSLLLKLFWVKYDVLLNPVCSRTDFQDYIVSKISATQKVGIKGNFANQKQISQNEKNRYYTDLVQIESAFEFDKNIEFFSKVFKAEMSANLEIDLPLEKPPITSDPYVVFFVGASSVQRKWPIGNFVRLYKYIVNFDPTIKVVFCGGIEDEVSSEKIANECPDGLNLIGKTTLVDLLAIIRDSRLIVSNDTAAIHMGAIQNIPSICLSIGNYHGRFMPNPYKANLRIVLPHNIDFETLSENTASVFSISDVKVDEVELLVKEYISLF